MLHRERITLVPRYCAERSPRVGEQLGLLDFRGQKGDLLWITKRSVTRWKKEFLRSP